jgi:streptogrisin C
VAPHLRTVLRVVLVLAAVATVAGAGVASAAPRESALAPAQVVMALLDTRTAAGMPAGVADYGIDGNAVGIRTVGTPDLGGLLAGIDPALVRVEGGGLPPRHQDLEGGQKIVGGTSRCTLGFTAARGAQDWIITAGHCTREADRWVNSSGRTLGSGAVTAGGGVDVGAVPVTSTEAAPPEVAGRTVRGSVPAPVGASVCLYGSTSGKTCGTITALNRTVNFDGEAQRGMTVASVCTAEGDSGGPYITADGQAQGVHSGAGDHCTAYFTPMAPALQALNLTLKTG